MSDAYHVMASSGQTFYSVARMASRVLAVGLLVAIGAVALLIRPRDPEVEAEVELFRSRFGRVVKRPPRGLHFHRHAHQMWLPADGGPMVYQPPYATHASGAAVVFITAPEDEATYVEKSDPTLHGEVTRNDRAPGRWMLDKLQWAASRKVGPYDHEAAIYVVSTGRVLTLPAGASLTLEGELLVFEPARSAVSAILKGGEKRYSQDDEELVIRDFFADRKGGVFLDVGAAHYRNNSTTFYLEEQLGWSGIAVDALAEYAEDYRTHRKRTTFVSYLVTDQERGAQKFYRAEGFPEVSSVSKQLAEEQGKSFGGSAQVSERTVPSITLDALLDGHQVRVIDFLSMDIEEHEPAALAGLTIERFKPQLVCIEAHEPVRDAIWRYFRRHGYLRQDQYLAWDSANWYFAPGNR
jgi:FkbM family methyltransferase